MKLYFEELKKVLDKTGVEVEVIDKKIEIVDKSKAKGLKTLNTGYNKHRVHICFHDERLCKPCRIEQI